MSCLYGSFAAAAFASSVSGYWSLDNRLKSVGYVGVVTISKDYLSGLPLHSLSSAARNVPTLCIQERIAANFLHA